MEYYMFMSLLASETDTSAQYLKTGHRLFKATALGLVSFGFITLLISLPQSFAQTQTPNVETHIAPPERFYPLVFRHVLHLQELDVKAFPGLSPNASMAPTTRTETSLARFFKGRIGLTSNEDAVLLQEAQQWKKEVDPVDEQAHNLVESIHAKTPGGRLASGQQPPQVPHELIKLQQERDTITRRHVANLEKTLGTERFEFLDGGLRREVRSGPLTTPSARATIGRGSAKK
jgi:hypothetical protein